MWWILITFLFLDIVHHVHGQDDQNNDAGDQPPADDKNGEEEEAWKYVEFLKDEIRFDI